MRSLTIKMLEFAAIGSAALLSGCATTSQLTADQRAQCEKMAEQMSVRSTHDHAQMKGTPANSMNVTHEKCERLLAKSSF